MKALEACTNAELIAVILRLEERVAELEAENAKLRKNSSTSSKPPSSDIVKPPKPKPKGKRKKQRRKIGGQEGHPKHDRQPFALEDLSDVWEYHLDRCPDCGGRVKRAEEEEKGTSLGEGEEKGTSRGEEKGEKKRGHH